MRLFIHFRPPEARLWRALISSVYIRSGPFGAPGVSTCVEQLLSAASLSARSLFALSRSLKFLSALCPSLGFLQKVCASLTFKRVPRQQKRVPASGRMEKVGAFFRSFFAPFFESFFFPDFGPILEPF